MTNQSLMHYTLTHMKLRTIVHELQPVSVVVARDVEMLSVVTRLLNRSGTNRDELAAVQECVSRQPLPAFVADEGEAAKDERTAWRRYYYQIGACSPQVSLGLRFPARLGVPWLRLPPCAVCVGTADQFWVRCASRHRCRRLRA